MKSECYPVSTLPHLSRLFLDYVEGHAPLSPFFPAAPFPAGRLLRPRDLADGNRPAIAELLKKQASGYGAGEQTLENIERLRAGASAVVTGQQVGIFGGPLLTLHKAATAIRLARDGNAAGGNFVPVFWMATEDHDFAEVNHVTVPSRHALHRLVYQPKTMAGSAGKLPVGSLMLDASIRDVLDTAAEFLGGSEWFEKLEQWYAPGQTLASAFAHFIADAFAPWGLIVIDASHREAHAAGREILAAALTRADELHAALGARDEELRARGYHAQVLTAPESSLLFVVDEEGTRLPLRHNEEGWKAGGRSYTTEALLEMLDRAPERLSPNALLRPVFQDAILPTSVYVGGPAEIAYFAQSQVLYQRLLGHTTPIIPRLSATLIEPAAANILHKQEVTLAQVIEGHQDLAARLGARALPVTGKQKIAAAGRALDQELADLTVWMRSMDESLGRAADVAASKMRYQMNRLRRLAAGFQLQKDESLRRQAEALLLALYPDRHPQERLIGGAYYLSRYGTDVPAMLVESADSSCPGHKAIWLS